MTEAANKAAVQRIYAAVARGDAPGFLQDCDPQVEWGLCTLSSAAWPKGHEAVAELHLRLDEDGVHVSFRPRTLVAEGDTVVAVGTAELREGRGRPQRSERVHVWTFRRGRALRVRAYEQGPPGGR